MISILATTPDDPNFLELVTLLDAELAITDGEDHDFYHQFNGTEKLSHVAVAYDEESTPIACGAIRPFDETSVELKRMYVREEARGRGAAYQVLCYFEVLIKKLGYQRCILETGIRQLPAIRLYERNGFTRIPGYGPYKGVEESVCMEKALA